MPGRVAVVGGGFDKQHKPFRGTYYQRGSGLGRAVVGRGHPTLYRGRYMQSGSGLGNFLAGLFRKFAPVLKRGAKKLLQTGAKAAASDTGQKLIGEAKKNLKRAATNAAIRGLRGENIVEGAKQDLKKAKQDIASALDDGKEKKGGGRGRWVAGEKEGVKKRKKKSGGGGGAPGVSRDAANILGALCAAAGDSKKPSIPIEKMARREPKQLDPVDLTERRAAIIRRRKKIPQRALI